jgi:hypothetical protein
MTTARARKEMRTAHLLLREARAYFADRLVVLCLLIVARQQIRAVHTRPLALCDNRHHDEHQKRWATGYFLFAGTNNLIIKTN